MGHHQNGIKRINFDYQVCHFWGTWIQGMKNKVFLPLFFDMQEEFRRVCKFQAGVNNLLLFFARSVYLTLLGVVIVLLLPLHSAF